MLLSLGGWRLIFLVNLPAGAVGLALGWFLLPRSRSRRRISASDRLGAVLLAVAAAGPLLYLSLATRGGFRDVALLAALAAGLLAAVGFIKRERSIDTPLIDLSILRRPALAIGLGTGLASYLALFGTLFVVPYFFAAQHVSVLRAGLELAVLPLATGIGAPIAGHFVDGLGSRRLTVGGLILAGVGLLEVAWHHGTAGVLLGLAFAGVGFGAVIPANSTMVMSASPAGHVGVVSGMLNMARGVGTALGIAVTGALFTTVAGVTGQAVAHTNATDAGHGLTAALAALGLSTLVAVPLAASTRNRMESLPHESASNHVRGTGSAQRPGRFAHDRSD